MSIFDADPLAGEATQPKLLSKATLDRVIVHITWVGSPDELPVGLNGAHVTGDTRGPELIGDDWHAYITCIQPDDFNDLGHLVSLGHECWHALGATHEPDMA